MADAGLCVICGAPKLLPELKRCQSCITKDLRARRKAKFDADVAAAQAVIDARNRPAVDSDPAPALPPGADVPLAHYAGSPPLRHLGAAGDPIAIRRRLAADVKRKRRARRMKRKRHPKVPARAKLPPGRPISRPVVIPKNPEAINDPVIQDLLQDVGKPVAEMSPLFHRLMKPVAQLSREEQRMRETLIMAVVQLEGGIGARAARRLNMTRESVNVVIDRQREHILDTPDVLKERREHAIKVERKMQDEVESMASLFIDISRKAAERLRDVLAAEGEITPAALANIARISSDKALVMAGLGPSRLGVRGAEKALSDTELDEQRQQNAQLLAAMEQATDPPDLKVVEGGH